MDNKKLGIVFLVMAIAVSVILIQMMQGLQADAHSQGCYQNEECRNIQSGISLTHFVFGFIGFMLALGVYLMFFSMSEEAILRRLEESKKKEVDTERFGLVLKGLDASEKEVMKAIRDQEGITQSTLRIRTNLSKAKLSTVLTELEKKALLKRERKGKTFEIFLREAY